MGFDGFFGNGDCGDALLFHGFVQFKETFVDLELDKGVMGVLEESLYLFEGRNELIFLLVDEGEDEAGLEVEVLGLGEEVGLVEDAVEEEVGVVDEFELFFDLSQG